MQNQPSLRLSLLALALVAAPAAASAQVGSLLRSQKIAEGEGGFAGPLDHNDSFGSSVAGVGDVNGDGVPDLAVGARGDGDGGPFRGAIWILFMDPNGRVQRQTKISQTQGGFTGALPDSAQLGSRIAALGDVDGDGVPDLAATTGRCPSEHRPRLWILLLNSNGTVKRHTVTVYHRAPAFVPTPASCDFESGGLAGLGDVDGDGVPDLVVGAPQDDDGPGANRGAIWIVRLDADATVKSTRKISQIDGGLTSELLEGGLFGGWIANLGDLDGDGNVDVAVTASSFQPLRILYLDDDQRVRSEGEISFIELGAQLGPGSYRPAPMAVGDVDRDGRGDAAFLTQNDVTLSFLASDGRLRKSLRIDSESFGFDAQSAMSYLGQTTSLGDLDGDGGRELVTTDPADGGPGNRKGAAYVLFTNPSPVRNGSGANPQSLKSGGDTILGATWSAKLDCSANAPGLAVLTGWSQAREGVLLTAGELLVGGQRLFVKSAVHSGQEAVFQENLPDDVALVNLELFVQGLCTGTPGPRLSNALDYLVGF